ncbi:hypothetical protein AGQ49_26195 [Salmonella enterica subsp. enterica]|nr:hypothetical protein AGQ49_26195 [Salmonella enterica subsp. enterica]
MDKLRAELRHLLGERLRRIESVNGRGDSALWSLYDSPGNPMPLVARSLVGRGGQESDETGWTL